MPPAVLRDKRRGKSKVVVALSTACVLASAVAIQKGLPVRGATCVIIHSDDAGMFPSVNQATIDAMEQGLVSSCSILAACPAFSEFADYARTHPGKDFGVHLDLTCEKDEFRWGPVLGAKRVPTLVDNNGFFWRTTKEVAKHAQMAEVESELRAQIERCRAAGIVISHLDHHMFVLYKRPDFIRLYVRLGLEYGVPIRYSLTPPALDDLDPSDQECVKAYHEGLELLRANWMPLCAANDMENYQVPPELKRSYYLDLFNHLRPGVTELIIHCAYVPEGPMRAPAVERREADTRVFMSSETADALKRRGICVLNWRTFRQMDSIKQN